MKRLAATCGGIAFCLLSFLSSLTGSVFLLAPLLLLAFRRPRLARHLLDSTALVWTTYVVALYEVLFGVKISVFEHVADSHVGKRNLIIMNHCTRIDWLFMYSYQLRYGSLRHLKIVLKSSLKHIPGPGWAMQSLALIFLRRKWEVDRITLETSLNYLRALNYPAKILLFPEGTDLTPDTKQKSDLFARKFNLKLYNYVLHPRTKAFVFIVNNMRDFFDSVLDVTIGYPKSMAKTELDILLGNIPKEVHLYIKEYRMIDLPASESELEKWCIARWEEKEEQLSKFYQTEMFKRKFSAGKTRRSEKDVRVLLYAHLLFGTLLTVFMLMLPFLSAMITYYMLATMTMFLLVGLVCGGWDQIQTHALIRYHQKE